MTPDNQKLRETRVYSGHGESDNRSHFERDRDRVLYTPAFRRLGGVAQVVHVNTERGYHNRLTHSLKVSQVGRRLAENLNDTADDVDVAGAGGLNADVVETACLAHDLGHPPFGHPAEEAIQNKLDNIGVEDSFEGNPQSFRIVNNVAIREESYMNREYQGLDLTLASLNAILKYPWARGTAGRKSKKWGHYSTEKEEFDKVRRLQTPGNSNSSMSLEAKIMDWADDLTYAIHDVVDFYKAGLIPLDELVRDTTERERFLDKFENGYGSTPSRWDGTGFLDEFLPNLATVAQTGRSDRKTHHIDTPFKDSSEERAEMSFMTSKLVRRYLGIGNDSVTIDQSIDGGLKIEPELECEVKLLQFLSKYYVFDSSALLTQQQGHKKIVKELFEVLFTAAGKDADARGILPTPFDEKINLVYEDNLGYDSIDTEILRARIVADIIASMTEQQAMELYERIAGSSPGLVTDRII